jgi:tetratricopeptide (TPR) repeat protein
MKLSRFWPLTILLLGLAGCIGSSKASTTGAKLAELIESGNAALAGGKPDEALAAFQSAVEAQPESAPAHERRAAAYLQLKKFEQAKNDCTAALKIDGKLAAAYFTRGLAEREMDDAEKAIDDFSNALDNGPEKAEILAARGATYHILAKAVVKSDAAAKILEKALKDFDRAVKFAPQQAEYHVQRGAVCLDLGDYEGAVTDCELPPAADPKLAARAHVIRARGECELSEFDKAISDCDAAIALEGGLIEAYVTRARARLEKSSEMRTLDEVAECRQAAVDCQKAIEGSQNYQGDPEGTKRETLCGLGHELRGSIYQSLHATKKAMAEYQRALDLDLNLVSTLLRRAATRSAAEDFNGALIDCNRAIDIDSTRPEAYSGRGMVYLMKLDFPKAIEDFTQAVSLSRKCARAFGGRASVYGAMASQELAKAKQLAETKPPVDPKELASSLEKVSALRQKCIEDASQAIDVNQHLAGAYLTRGLAYALQQVPDKAFRDFAAAIREDPKLVKAYYNRGVLFYKQWQTRTAANDKNAGKLLDAAIKDFEEAGKLQPDIYLFDYRLYQCYWQKPDLLLAKQYLEQAKEKEKRHGPQNLEEGIADAANGSVFKPKKASAPLPDADLDPLTKAQKELEAYLDSTAEKSEK